MTEKERSVKSCREIREKPFLTIDTIKFKTCPGNFTSASVIAWLTHHESFRRGVLPFPGALLDQPNKVIELFGQFDSHYAEQAEASRKKAAMQAAKGKARG